MPKYPVYVWTVKSIWLSGAETYDRVYIALPNLELSKRFIFEHVKRFFPISDVRRRITMNLLRVINPEEVLPVAYRLRGDEVWESPNVVSEYPDIQEYWTMKGFTDIRIVPCQPVDEDCLYLNGKWYSYCRFPHEWMQPEDLCDELKPPVGIRNRRNCTV